MDFKEQFRAHLIAQRKNFDVWNEIISELETQRVEAQKFKREKEKLEKVVNEEKNNSAGNSGNSGEKSEKISFLEEKCYKLQEEVTTLLRSKSANSEQLVTKNEQVSQLEKDVQKLKEENETYVKKLEGFQKTVTENGETMKDFITGHQALQDEHAALQLTYNQLEKRFLELQTENGYITKELLRAREQLAEFANAENTAAMRLAEIEKQREIEIAIRDATLGDGQSRKPEITFTPRCSAPVKKVNEFQANNGEVFEVKFSADGHYLATAGEDKVVNIYNVSRPAGRIESPVVVLKGCNSAVTSISFSPSRKSVLASSNDTAARVWDFSTGRVQLTLTGHQSSVTCARYLNHSQAVTGSSDRTLRVWDISKGQTTKTLWKPGSKCTDVCSVAMDGSVFASAHFNKQIQFFDIRTKDKEQVVTLGNKITGLAASSDFSPVVLAVTRDNELSVIDMRQMLVQKRLSDPEFRVAADYTRCTFSPCGGLALGVGTEGRLSCWDIHSGQLLDSTNSGNSAFISTDWHNKLAASSSRNKTVTLWTDV